MKKLVLLLVSLITLGCQSKNNNPEKVELQNMNTDKGQETAIFAGGCFWCTEAVFLELDGVLSIKPGYIGGKQANPTYEDVCSGYSGHAEAVKIVFDPSKISYGDLLQVFFATHDPTTLNRQGADAGTQYRSEVFYTNTEQKKEAQDYINQLNFHNAYSTIKKTISTR